jgi:hypothetical protein
MYHIYRFKITVEDNDDFLRVVEVPAHYTFYEFHLFLRKVLKLENNELASFYLVDSKWKKKKEITLIDMNVDEDEKSDKPLLMEKVKLNQVIEDPHQHLVYIYDFLNMYTFYLELLKTFSKEDLKEFPRVIESKGDFFVQQPNIKNFTPIAGSDNIIDFDGSDIDPEDLENMFSDENEEDNFSENEFPFENEY